MTRSNDAAPQLKRVLGLGGAMTFGLAYMIPLTVFTTLGIANVMTDGNLVAAYAITLVAMAFTAVSYATMVRRHPVAGSAYTFSRRTFGGHVGFLAGWALLLDYLLLPMVTYLVIGIYLNAAFPAIPMWVFFVAALVLVTILNIIGIRLLAGVNVALLALQVVFIGVFLVMVVGGISGTSMPSLAEVFLNDRANLVAILSGSALLCFSFLGFDAVSTLAEETKAPERTLPRAIILVTVLGGLLFMLLSAASNLVFPDYTTYSSPDSASLDVMAAAGGELLSAFFTAAYVAGCFASVMASQATVSRILFAMGRDRMLPRRLFAFVHPRFRTPAGATAAVAVVSLVGLALDLMTLSSLISFGALVAFSMVNLSVIKHHLVDERRRGARAILLYGVLPGIGFLLTAWLWTSLSGSALAVGLIWVGVGVVILAVMTRGFRQPPPQIDVDKAETAGIRVEEPEVSVAK
ncbi:amino acid/polyamine/organocation transporter, APC superfamily [Agrococcus baldri]|uniref:Amino acid/polyamine/organocation transporter, APC superfamily n=1 Tax=Agrococcus baldri TaxID=153730 RepID=A0AA94HL58_9MICO|nr:APC family permease [Agrococcus baldri]SFR99219.1 amino acid/polyamine/organocation transporter, APC superfamily [Agrococcus baldri]